MGALQQMLDSQRTLQEEFDARAASPNPRQSCEYIKDMCTALMAETVELMEETGWKPWSTSWHINVDSARGEWIDAWHFMMNLANKLGMDETMISQKYQAKADINRRRIRTAYNGVDTKCPGCKRALDDPATNCFYMTGRFGSRTTDQTRWVWCTIDNKVGEISGP